MLAMYHDGRSAAGKLALPLRFLALSLCLHGLLLMLPKSDTRPLQQLPLAAPLQVSLAATAPARQGPVPEPVDPGGITGSHDTVQQAAEPLTTAPPAVRPPSRPTAALATAMQRATMTPTTDHADRLKTSAEARHEQIQPTAAPATDSRRQAVVNHLQQRLKSMIAARFTYPRLARRMGWEGLVSLSLQIETDGRLQRVRVKRTSGHRILDENARQTVAGLGRINLSDTLHSMPVATEVEVLYRLTN